VRALRPSSLLLAALVGVVLGVGASALTVSLGLPLPVSPPTLILTILGLGVVAIALTIPLVRYRSQLEKFRAGSLSTRPGRPNPFYAYRVLIWARASAIAGAAFLGWHLGQLVWLSSFAVPVVGVIQNNGLGASAAAALVVLAWLAERNCRSGQDSDGGSEVS
jgi:hypothetical protein